MTDQEMFRELRVEAEGHARLRRGIRNGLLCTALSLWASSQSTGGRDSYGIFQSR